VATVAIERNRYTFGKESKSGKAERLMQDSASWGRQVADHALGHGPSQSIEISLIRVKTHLLAPELELPPGFHAGDLVITHIGSGDQKDATTVEVAAADHYHLVGVRLPCLGPQEWGSSEGPAGPQHRTWKLTLRDAAM
jgi:hypothetical protein